MILILIDDVWCSCTGQHHISVVTFVVAASPSIFSEEFVGDEQTENTFTSYLLPGASPLNECE